MKKIFDESPFITELSFHKIIEIWEDIVMDTASYKSGHARKLLKDFYKLFETDSLKAPDALIFDNPIIAGLLEELFPKSLTRHELKAASAPFTTFFFHRSEGFAGVLDAAGIGYEPVISNISPEKFYILNCCIILKQVYAIAVDIEFPLIMDVPDQEGIMRHYKVSYNLDFLEIESTIYSKSLTMAEVENLLNSRDNIDLWKEMFPTDSWIIRGFMLFSLVDVTTETAISTLKSILVRPIDRDLDVQRQMLPLFRSIFNIVDLNGGFYLYDKGKSSFRMIHQFDYPKDVVDLDLDNNPFFIEVLEEVVVSKQAFVISNMESYDTGVGGEIGGYFANRGVLSCMFSPAIKDDMVIGIAFFFSSRKYAINAITDEKLMLILPILTDSINRVLMEMETEIEAVIQREYTSIHKSVYWKFREEVKKRIDPFDPLKANRETVVFEDIVFKDVYALYGQIDIKGSSEKKNQAIVRDLKRQIGQITDLLLMLEDAGPVPFFAQIRCMLERYGEALDKPFQNELEQLIRRYIESEVHPILKTIDTNHRCYRQVLEYLKLTDPKTGLFFQSRKELDDSIMTINGALTALLDEKNQIAQQAFPHYYERFKTDGVEHNFYIGESIQPNRKFEKFYLDNLRLFQFETMCEMEHFHYQLCASLPCQLEVASLILVFSPPISIRFRMDEKHFDVDGSYNARYEIVKKRLDKALIKGTDKRITEPYKITIVYSLEGDGNDYIKYAKYLQHKGLLEEGIEKIDVEDLQGVSGLKAIRVKLNIDYITD
ncbi:GAF domain-containing protein [Algoriphagus sp. Y33]|uniref:GAF domain-containing protein n=1 Tax=Algoriphagus sp. Y33 TaxID=2772483 RepID=UPI00177E8F55|nr:GAF domain-containing protein [Algoriphagus sp. Y33]